MNAAAGSSNVPVADGSHHRSTMTTNRATYLFFLVALMVDAACPGCRKDERHFGRRLGEQTSGAISDLVSNTEAYLDQEVVVHGRIKEVCQTAGCWCILEDGQDQLYVSLSTFSLPRDVAGRRCRAAGRLVMRNDRPTFLATGIELLQE